jgi:hypothetical protein
MLGSDCFGRFKYWENVARVEPARAGRRSLPAPSQRHGWRAAQTSGKQCGAGLGWNSLSLNRAARAVGDDCERFIDDLGQLGVTVLVAELAERPLNDTSIALCCDVFPE